MACKGPACTVWQQRRTLRQATIEQNTCADGHLLERQAGHQTRRMLSLEQSLTVAQQLTLSVTCQYYGAGASPAGRQVSK